MAYSSREKQVADAVGVLCLRLDVELRKSPRKGTSFRRIRVDWRKRLVEEALDEINDKVGTASIDDDERAFATKKKIIELHLILKRAARLRSSLPDSVQRSFNGLDGLLAAADVWSRRPSRKKVRAGHRQSEAVRWAALIIDVTDEYPMTVTRHNQWYRLSAILSGDKDANLFNQMRNHTKRYKYGWYEAQVGDNRPKRSPSK
jgi:hypothetical protein